MVGYFSRYLMWGSYLKTVQVKSTQSTNSPPLSGVGVVNSSCFLTIAVFKLHPLELLTCLPIQRKVRGGRERGRRGGEVRDFSLATDFWRRHYRCLCER